MQNSFLYCREIIPDSAVVSTETLPRQQDWAMEGKRHMRWTTESLSLFLCFTSVEAEIAGSADAPRRRRWQHHASVFSPSIHLSMSSDITPSPYSGIHPSSAQTHTPAWRTSTMRRWSGERCSERGRAGSRKETEVENESVGLSSSVQQRRSQTLKTPFRQRQSQGGRGRQQEQLLLPAANHSPRFQGWCHRLVSIRGGAGRRARERAQQRERVSVRTED